ncbi:MAG: hypothetical protein ABFS45_19730 [Pseudomonadota bacterium]
MNTNTQDIDIQKAITDIAIIRQVLNNAEQDQIDSKLVGITLDANLLLQSIAFVCALALCIMEIVTGGTMTVTLMSGGQFDEMRKFGIVFMGAILVGLLIPLYFVIWRAARHNGEDISSYVSRNFKYLKNLSFISDLLMKFFGIALILLADKPEWVAPLLAAFTGDYLLQNRFFTLSTKVSAVLGMVCIAVAIYLFVTSLYALIVPLAIFTAITGVSTSRLIIKYKQQETAAE